MKFDATEKAALLRMNRPNRPIGEEHEDEAVKDIATVQSKMMVKIVAGEERLFALDARMDEWKRSFTLRFEEYQESIQKALALQAMEYERRLEHLNGEHARTAKVLEFSVTKEVFEKYTDNDKMWKVGIEKDIVRREIFDKFYDEDRRWKESTKSSLDEQAGRKAGFLAMVSLLFALSGIALTVFGKYF